MWGEAVVFDSIHTAGRVRVDPKVPSWWRLRLADARGYDVDNLSPEALGPDAKVAVAYDLDAVYLRGPSAKGGRFSATSRKCVRVDDGAQVLEANGEFTVAVTDMNAPVKLGGVSNVSKHSLAPKPLKYRKDYLSECDDAPDDDGTIHVFSVASGLTYERLLRIMMASVAVATSAPVKFWLLEEFLSPDFDVGAVERALDVRIGLLETPPWPEFLTDSVTRAKIGIRNDKQRLIWAYKILFLDLLFVGKTDRLIFVDADQIVKHDLGALWSFDLGGAPYGFVPFCHGKDANPSTKGHRFWDSGFWRTHLAPDFKYHISALFVVDLAAFRAYADVIRSVFKGMGADPNSLANLDQDLPNYLQTNGVPIKSLPQSWLYCEAWCAPHTKTKAKSIDMCQNPLTKEHKLDMAKRVAAPLWTKLDDYITDALSGDAPDLPPLKAALKGVTVTADAAPVDDEL